MKKSSILKALSLVLLATTTFFSCKKDHNPEEEHEHHHEGEHTFVRLMVADQNTTTLSMIDPSQAKVTNYIAKFPLGTLYATASRRHVAILNGANNLVEIFNSGLRLHDDHVDVDGAAAMTTFTSDGLKPAHFISYGTQTMIFNDNSGTISTASDADFSTANGKFRQINMGLFAHHGAMTPFVNSTFAVTKSTGAGVSPNGVMVVNADGTVKYPSTLTVGSIHGNATDGTTGVFGAYKDATNQIGGILVVKQDGTQTFIENPAGFGAARLGTVLYAKKAKKFIGYSAAKGAYLVDVAANKITPIYAAADAFQCKVDYAGENLVLLTLDGKLKIYNLNTGALKKEIAVIGAVASADTYKPILEATAQYGYIAMPTLGEVLQINLEDGDVVKHKVSANPVRMTLFGFEISETHNH
ncbi:hypothetical protein [Pedobacter sp. MW01-1-1]|uniref:hypothetical protein n=1 Tax=Pedobacter sp. MW01-1-1 TaxID=3383027 RepID=UPI003FEF7105